MQKLLSTIGLVFKSADSDFPLLNFFLLVIQSSFKLLVIILPFFLFMNLLLQPVFPLSGRLKVIFFVSEDFIESKKFLVDQDYLIFIVCDYVFIVSKLHETDLVFLYFLFIILDLSISIFEHFSSFSDFILET